MRHIFQFSIIAASVANLAIASSTAAQHRDESKTPQETAMFSIPASLRIEHEELHQELSAATKLSGRTAQAARRVAEVLHPHFVSEEEYALPPLGLLSTLATGKATSEMRDVLGMTDKLKANVARMLEEHKAIVGALDELRRAAQDENHPEVIRFAEKLKVHAETEEQVLYPAAILVGEYVKAVAPHQR